MALASLTNYDLESNKFAQLPEYSLHCGTDYVVVKEAPGLISKIQPLKKILDLGCGTGLATRFLKKHFPDATIVGADINTKMLEQAIQADPFGIYLHIKELNNDFHYPFMDNTFDAIICSFVLHENRTKEKLTAFFKTISNLLRPNGLFLGWDVYENLFQGQWLTIDAKNNKSRLEDGDQYKVRILPSSAEVTGTYWKPETLIEIAESLNFCDINVNYPIADKADAINWLAETKSAPYFLFSAKK